MLFPNSSSPKNHKTLLKEIARRAMIERHLFPDFSSHAIHEVAILSRPREEPIGKNTRDLRSLPWCSIDNEETLDLDQLSVAIPVSAENTIISVAIADVDSFAKKGSGVDEHARQNTISVYTPAEVFPMLPEQLSTNLTSLVLNHDRLALVVEMTYSSDGQLLFSDIYRALVRNHAKLSYHNVSEWLLERGELPSACLTVQGLQESLHFQDKIAQQLREQRHRFGTLSLETPEARPIFIDHTVKDLVVEHDKRGRELIENLMIATGQATVAFLKKKGISLLRRVVRAPKRWDRIVELASRHSFSLPSEPHSLALENFLSQQRTKDSFPDLSLSVIKLLGKGEYLIESPDQELRSAGHFGLSLSEYTHSTAPNRRYSDLITQRLLKAVLDDLPVPYEENELKELAKHCTQKEDDAAKVERRVKKSAAALLLEPRIGQIFEAICTGAAEKGTWVRITNPHVEGKLLQGAQGLDVGEHLKVELTSVNAERGWLDFKRANPL